MISNMFNRSLADANAAIPSHLHPVALRSTANASNAQTAAASQLAEAQLRVSQPPPPSPPVPSLDHAHSRQPTPTASCSSASSSTSSFSSLFSATNFSTGSTDRPAGLPIDPNTFPSLSTVNRSSAHSDSIRLITCSDYANVYHHYLRSAAKVDESTVFPYLHCPDRPGTAQATYFSQAHLHHPQSVGPTKRSPAYRGLTVITADPILPPRGSTTSITNARHRTRSLGSASTISASSVSSSNPLSSASSPATSIDGPEPRASLLISALSPDEVLERDRKSGRLLPKFMRKPLPTSSVNLRLFGHQPSQYATISDIVIYSEAGLTDGVIELANLVVEAQIEHQKTQRTLNAIQPVQYHVMIVNEMFESFEKEYGHLVAVDGWGFKRSKVDFFERERLEMETLTTATEIEENVWLGNTADAIKDEEQIGLGKFSIMIEAHDSARIPGRSELATVSTTLLSSPSPSSSASCSTPPPPSSPIRRPTVHLEVPSTAPTPAAGSMSMDQLARALQEFCDWVSKVAASGHRVLVHCHDGYTETSLFGLAYVIYSRRCPVSAAYLHLQHHANRSFFLYPSDLSVLKYFERRCSYSDPTLNPIPRGERWLEEGFEGHFPSRILPFLYLGNLSHATNVGMLKALGITAVVSMGESARGALTGRSISLLDIKAVADDGLDRISAHLPTAIEFIDQTRRSGGKVLVHCRVGVSRSATVVIGYVMAHCSIDLAAAYLLVRSRRLNILIQPNLVFMWALRKWESQLMYYELDRSIEAIKQAGQAGDCDCGICGEAKIHDDQDSGLDEDGIGGEVSMMVGSKSSINRKVGASGWTWSALALEISLLNQRYLC